jgi:hypothetical protein
VGEQEVGAPFCAGPTLPPAPAIASATAAPRLTDDRVSMARRSRILAFGSASALILAGTVCAVLVGDGVGQILALVLVGTGLVLATSLVFLEVGLSEDRERELRQRERRKPRLSSARSPISRLERMRGRSRRLK